MNGDTTRDIQLENQLWQDPNWDCPHCHSTNIAIREHCRMCGYDSNAGEFPYYNPMPDLHLWTDEQVAELKRKGLIVETHELQSDDDYKDEIPW